MKPSTTPNRALLVALLFAGTAGIARAQSDAPISLELADAHSLSAMTGEIIQTIEDFEAEQDAKCYATASRLENFIYGTPLSDDARFLKIDLQKAVIASVWRQASTVAAQRGVRDGRSTLPERPDLLC